MNPTPSPDPLDRLLSDFFQTQLRRPWPPAPLPPPAEGPVVTPARSSAPSRASIADPAARARYTLAASVALLLGTCWYLSAGLPVGPRAAGPRAATPDLLPDMTAGEPDALKQLRKDHAEKADLPPMVGFPFE